MGVNVAEEISLEYLAGLVDADGCLTITKSQPSKSWRTINPTYKIVVSVSNTCLPVIEELREQFGGFVVTMKARKNSHRVCYQWILGGRLSELLLLELVNHLRIKVRQAGLLLALRSWCQPDGGYGICDNETIMMRETIYQECKRMNSGNGERY